MPDLTPDSKSKDGKDQAKERFAWMPFLTEDTLNGHLLRGCLAVETHLRSLLNTYAKERFGCRNYEDQSLRFSLVQMYEIAVASNLLPDSLRPTIKALHSARNRIAHDAFERHDRDRINKLYDTLPADLLSRLKEQVNFAEAPVEKLTRGYFTAILVHVDDGIARAIARARLEKRLIEGMLPAIDANQLLIDYVFSIIESAMTVEQLTEYIRTSSFPFQFAPEQHLPKDSDAERP